MTSPRSSPPASRGLQAYLELLRLPNVFTAMADVALGYLFTHESFEPWPIFVLLLLASSFLYLAGIVLNDYFDRELDARERPERPLPSGRIAPAAARWLGTELLLVGAGLGWLASYQTGCLHAGLVVSLLAGCVLAYDRWLKATPLGPLAMGACRGLNVLLGMSAAAEPWQADCWLVAAGIGTYIVGVTWFARTEAKRSDRRHLILGTVVMMAGIGVLSRLPEWTSRFLMVEPAWWRTLLAVLGLLIGWRCVWAAIRPVPFRVQAAVRQCILSVIVLDAAVCVAVRGQYWAAMILLLLLPATMLGRRIRVT
ncbi:MAG: UbiA family prenyltransferase [Pirellulales bacterium]